MEGDPASARTLAARVSATDHRFDQHQEPSAQGGTGEYVVFVARGGSCTRRLHAWRAVDIVEGGEWAAAPGSRAG
jgi:hypothetical protein